MPPTRERLEAEQAQLERALRAERAQAALERHDVPEHFAALLTELPPEQVDPAAQAIAREIGSHPAGRPPLPDQEEEGLPGMVGGETSGEPEEFSDPENVDALRAVTSSGPEGGSPPDPGPLNPKDRTVESIRATSSWNEFEALQAQMRKRG